MPPPASKKPHLTADEIAILRRWIEQGAEYEGHWAFLPLANAQPPAVKNEAWIANPIDHFILARLEQEGIAPSPAADPATLIRRVSLDLTGLLPTPEEVAGVRRTRASASLRRSSCDRLLASPHYGERWGRHWLDQARYADTQRLHDRQRPRRCGPIATGSSRRSTTTCRSISSRSSSSPATCCPNATKSQLVATGFHRNTLINEEGGTDKEQFRHEAVVDRVNTTGAVWLGLTVGCASATRTSSTRSRTASTTSSSRSSINGTDVNNRGADDPVTRGEMFGQPRRARRRRPRRAASSEAQPPGKSSELARLDKARHGSRTPPPPSWSPAKYVEYDTESNAGFRLLDDNSLLSDGRGAAQRHLSRRRHAPS